MTVLDFKPIAELENFQPPHWGGLLFFRRETQVFRGREIETVVAGCPGCGWSGAPTFEDGSPSTFCPSCEVEKSEAVGDLRAAEPEDVFGRGPWARHRDGSLYRPRPARATYVLESQKGTSTMRRAGAKVGRNDPCPCGSARKFKKCCGAS